jgi:hypothetical protein
MRRMTYNEALLEDERRKRIDAEKRLEEATESISTAFGRGFSLGLAYAREKREK